MIKVVSLLCLLAVVVYAKPAVNKEEDSSQSMGFLKVIKLPKVPETDKCDVTGRITLFSGPYCGGAKTVNVCDGRCFYLDGSSAYSLKTSNFPDGYEAIINFYTGGSCNDGYTGSAFVKDNTCYGDKDANFKAAGSFSCVTAINENDFTKSPPKSN